MVKSASGVIWHGSCWRHGTVRGSFAMSRFESIAFTLVAGLAGLLTVATVTPVV
jgi:hypothetical protein